VKNTTVHGLFWGSYVQHQPSVLRSSMDDIMGWLASGAIKPHVSHTFPLAAAPHAMHTLLTRQARGKVLLLMDPNAASGSDLRHQAAARPVSKL
jgi:NADPH:quinone reductase-like Zn-dependent oxidoreductase